MTNPSNGSRTPRSPRPSPHPKAHPAPSPAPRTPDESSRDRDPATWGPELSRQFDARMALKRRSPRTAKAYRGWIRRFLSFHSWRHPREMGEPEVTAFLTDLAVHRHVAASTQNQALAALLFLYGELLDVQLPWLDKLVRARRPKHMPTVMTREEVRAVLAEMEGTPKLMSRLMYGAGLRLLECARLRIKDLARSIHEHTRPISQTLAFGSLSAPGGTLRHFPSSTTLQGRLWRRNVAKHRQEPSCCVGRASS